MRVPVIVSTRADDFEFKGSNGWAIAMIGETVCERIIRRLKHELRRIWENRPEKFEDLDIITYSVNRGVILIESRGWTLGSGYLNLLTDFVNLE
jgi:hypothetical protein